jgi:Nif-specific regulatory protein
VSNPSLKQTAGVSQAGLLSPTLARLTRQAATLGQGDAPVLIAGERGSRPERELLARTVHKHSRRADRPFIKLSWEFLSESFVEAKLFGGQTSNPDEEHDGLISDADNGTLYIEELERFSLATQEKLYTLVASGKYTPVNAGRQRTADIRLVAGTNHSAAMLRTDDDFLPDLRSEFALYTIEVPPLRERRDEIAQIAQQVCIDHAHQTGGQIPSLSPDAIAALTAHDWPENVEELTRSIKMAADACSDDILDVQHLPAPIIDSARTPPTSPANLRETLDRVERTMIVEALQDAGGNQTRAAKALGISERLMGLRVRKYGLKPRQYRTKT